MESYNLDIYQGETFVLEVNSTNCDGTPTNLLNYNISGSIKELASSTGTLATFTVLTGTGTASGAFTISLSSTVTKSLTCGQYTYGLDGTISGSTVNLIQGYANVYPDLG